MVAITPQSGAVESAVTRVLLVEDNFLHTQLIRTVLSRPPFQVVAVKRLREAIELVRTNDFTAILLDLELPDSDGIETLEAMIEVARDSAIVVITAHDDAQYALQALGAGASDYLIKGRLDAETLTRSVRYAIERKRAEQRLLSSEARFRAIIESSLEAIVGITPDGLVTAWNQRARLMFGYDVDEALGKPFAALVKSASAFPHDLVGRRVELMALRRDRSEFPIEMSVSSIEAESGPEFCAFISDITERKRLEVEREGANQRFRALKGKYEVILDSAGTGIFGIDCDDRISFGNPAAARMLGFDSAAHFEEQPAHQSVHGPETGECPIRATLLDGAPRLIQSDQFLRRDGNSFPVSYSVAPIRDYANLVVGAVVSFVDVTRQREMESQVEQAMRVSSLGRVSASVAHEFNNVLMAIQPFAELLQKRMGSEDSVQRPVKHILEAIKRGQRMTSQILRFTRPAEPTLESIDAAAWIRAFADEARSMLIDRNILVEIADHLPVRVDVMQLHQVFINLVANARHATAAGDSVTIGAGPATAVPYVRERLSHPEDHAVLFVRDTGKGIPADVLPRIFEPFFTTKRGGGTGLGLAVAHQVIAHQGGQIMVESQIGRGAAFFIVLPTERKFDDARLG